MSLKCTYFLLWAMCLGANAQPKSDPVFVRNGFIKASDFRTAGVVEKSAWVMGFIDSVHTSVLWGAPPSKVAWIQDCTRTMNSDQLIAIFEKYLAEHPADWNKGMNLSAFNALGEACPR